MFKLSASLLEKIQSKINQLQPVCAGVNGANFKFSDCPCQGQCGNTGSSAQYHCPCAKNDSDD